MLPIRCFLRRTLPINIIIFLFQLGGGLGGTRAGGPEDNVRHSGRVEQWEG